MKRGDELELTIESFADKGKSLARVDGYVVFVGGAVPGDKVRAQVFKKKRKHAEARILEVLEPSPLRVEPRCAYFGVCGGCKWQHVDYWAQLEAKRESVEGALRYEAGLSDIVVEPTLPSPDVYFYRNKMEFSFSAERWLTQDEIGSDASFDRDFGLGLHPPGFYGKVVDLHECHLQSELSVRIVNRVRQLAKWENWQPWNVHTHEGFLRHLVIRQGVHTGETLVNLVTNGFVHKRMEQLATTLQNDCPEVTTLVNTIHTGLGQTSIGEETRTIYGPGLLHDTIGGLTFEIDPHAFFQTNTKGAEVLYTAAREAAGLTADALLYDLYCGAGTISLFCAPHVKHVVGVELVPEAVANAKANAERNGISNATFVAGDMLKLFTPEFVREHGTPDVLIVDPPRAGMHHKVVKQIAELAPERLVYVSCNPRSQARDLAGLLDTYTVERVQPVDMFPHTAHVETVMTLRRK